MKFINLRNGLGLIALFFAHGFCGQSQCDHLPPLVGSLECKERCNRWEGFYVAKVGVSTLVLCL
jgi:hypothetical protein